MHDRKQRAGIDEGVDKGLEEMKSSLSGDFRVPPQALERAQNALLATLRPVRPLTPGWVFLALLAAVFLVLVAMGAHHLGAFGWAVLTGLQKLTIFSSLAASAALLGFATVAQMTPGSRHRIPPALVPVAAFVLLVIAVAGVLQYGRDPHFVRAGMGCLIGGIPFAIPAAVVFFLVLRRGVVLHPILAGGMSGMLAGLIGTSVLEIHCPILDVRHVLVWHLGVCVVGALAGLLAGLLGLLAKRNFSS